MGVRNPQNGVRDRYFSSFYLGHTIQCKYIYGINDTYVLKFIK